VILGRNLNSLLINSGHDVFEGRRRSINTMFINRGHYFYKGSLFLGVEYFYKGSNIFLDLNIFS
jgi:hypothetical protein